MKFDIKATALACGSVAGAYMLLLGVAAGFGWGVEIVSTIGSIYVGFAPGFVGGLIGAVYGFIDGAIAGAVFAWVYNKLAKK